ncbi:uncharacterized protein [Salminus brasiliensis]|uniref:uncharacterized protein isoform X2 n=1 Tax=Salminus brasiliensis TaxID=930266 RepID=UPI003B82CE89
MKPCVSALRGLLLLTITTSTDSAFPSVKVKLHDSAVLPCTKRCSGLVRWTVFHKPNDTLAECNQTSCRSVKKGYQMIHEEYLKGNFSLVITEADFSKRARYTSKCADKDLCDVALKTKPVDTPVQIKTGQSLLLDLDTAESVEVRYNGTDSSSGLICTVDGRSTQCKPDYTNRASVISALELRRTKPSDSGVYAVWDIRNDELIRTYTVTVQDGGDGSEALGQVHKLSRNRRSAESDCQQCVCSRRGGALPGWVVPVLLLMGAVCGVLVGVIVWLVKRHPQTGPVRNGDANQPQNGFQENGGNRCRPESIPLSPSAHGEDPV